MAKHESREDKIFQKFKTKIAQEPEQVKQSSCSSTLCSICGYFRGVIPKEAVLCPPLCEGPLLMTGGIERVKIMPLIVWDLFSKESIRDRSDVWSAAYGV